MTITVQFPLTEIQLEIINLCNFKCPLCKTLEKDWVPRRSIPIQQVRSIIDPVAQDLKDITLYGNRGEPLLHKDIHTIVAYLKQATSAKVSISTNASLLTDEMSRTLLESGLDQMVFAVDGITQESYGAYRHGGNLDQILKNIKQFCEIKTTGQFGMRTVFQFIPMADNEHELADIPSLAYDLGVDLVKAKFSSSVARSDTFKTENKIFQDLISNKNTFNCPFGTQKMYVDPNGFGYPCCYAEGVKELCMGNTIDDIISVWESAAMQRYKKAFIEQDHFPQFCLDKCYQVPRKKKLLIRKNEIENQQWLDDVKETLSVKLSLP